MGFIDSLALISIVGLTGRLVFDSPPDFRSDPWTDGWTWDSWDSTPSPLTEKTSRVWSRVSDEVAHLTSWSNAPCSQVERFGCRRPLVLPVTSSLLTFAPASTDVDSNRSSPLDWLSLLATSPAESSPDSSLSPMATAMSPMTTAIDWLDGIEVDESSTSDLMGAAAASNDVDFDTFEIDDAVVTSDDMDDLIRYIEGSPSGTNQIKNDQFLGTAEGDISMDDSFKLAFDTDSPVKPQAMNYSFPEIDQLLFGQDYESQLKARESNQTAAADQTADKIDEADKEVDDFLEQFLRTSGGSTSTPSADESSRVDRTTQHKSSLSRTFAPASVQPAKPVKLQPANNIQAPNEPADLPPGEFNADHASVGSDGSGSGDDDGASVSSDISGGAYAGSVIGSHGGAGAGSVCGSDGGGGGGGGSSASTSTSSSERPLWPAISLTTEELVVMHIDRFNEAIAVLSETGKLLARKIRQKGKNKLAARTCRKRRIDEVGELGAEIDELVRQKSLLLDEKTRLREETKSLNDVADWLNNYIVQHLRSTDGGSPAQRNYRVECFDNGSVFLVPSAVRLDEPRKRVLASA